jgi:pimeloyl-ACP methyl ester carboxylesterase
MPVAIARPKLEGNIAVGDDRQIGFAEFGDPQGRAVFWLHGTPGARRQIPMEARVYAEQRQIRLIGIDRPGIGSSTPYQYDTVFAFADDLRTIADTLGIDKMEVIGLSGGGPYTLACAAAMPDRVVAAGVIGGVAPTTGADGIAGGVMGSVGLRVAPLLRVAGGPLGVVASALIRLIRPVGSPAVDLYGRVSPEADRQLLARPEIKAMFLDDLLNGSRKQMAAPFADVVVFARDWGFRLDEVKVPVRWWHGDHDHIVPFDHGLHVVAKLPDVEMYHLPGESHLAGLGRAEEILETMVGLWDRVDQK